MTFDAQVWEDAFRRACDAIDKLERQRGRGPVPSTFERTPHAAVVAAVGTARTAYEQGRYDEAEWLGVPLEEDPLARGEAGFSLGEEGSP